MVMIPLVCHPPAIASSARLADPRNRLSLAKRQFIRVVPHKVQGTYVGVIAAIETDIAIVRRPGTLGV